MNKIFNTDEQINVVFLGGSITEGAGASHQSKCYANLTGEWLKTKFGNSLKYHNKGVGGTPSAYGLLRFERDVSAYNPDMVFIEFAVNDGGNDTRKYVEGLVRSLISLPSKPYVVFLYTTNATYETKTNYFEEVAEYYGIPQIYLKNALKNHLKGENAKEAGYLKDAVHPTDMGYKVYFDEMVRCLSDKAYYKRPLEKSANLVDDCITLHTIFTPSRETELTGNWKKWETDFGQCIIGNIGDSLEFEFNGDIVAFEHGLHKDGTMYEVYDNDKLIGTGNSKYKDFITNQLVMGFNTFDLKYGYHKIKVINVKNDIDYETNKQVLFYNIITGEKTER